MESHKKRVKALTLAVLGSMTIILMLVFMIWTLRLTVKWVGQEYWTDSSGTIEITDLTETAGIVGGIAVGLQQINRDEPYQLEVMTYVAKNTSLVDKQLVNKFNDSIQEFVNNVRIDFESELDDQILRRASLEIESQSIQAGTDLIIIDYKITKSIRDSEFSVYRTLEVRL